MRLILFILICYIAFVQGSRVPKYYADGELVEHAEKKIDFDQLEDYVEKRLETRAHSPSPSPSRSPLYVSDILLNETEIEQYDYRTRDQWDIMALEVKTNETQSWMKSELEKKQILALQMRISLEYAKMNVIFIFPFILSGAFLYVFVKKYGIKFDPSQIYKFK